MTQMVMLAATPTNKGKSKKERLIFFDVARIGAILLVVSQHLLGALTQVLQYLAMKNSLSEKSA